MKCTLACTALGIAIWASPAIAEDWRLTSVDSDRVAAFFIDLDSLTKETETVRRVRVLIVAATGAEPYDAAETDAKIDCVNDKIRLGRATSYDATGKVTGVNDDRPDLPWQPIAAGSNFRSTADMVCGSKPMTTRKFGSSLPIAAGRGLLSGN